jgi:hypothetical protein
LSVLQHKLAKGERKPIGKVEIRMTYASVDKLQSALAPIFFSIAGRLSNGKNAIAVAQLSFMNILIIFISKTILAWVVELTSITVALCLTGAAMFALVYFGNIGSTERK